MCGSKMEKTRERMSWNSLAFLLLGDFHEYPEHGPIARLTELHGDKRYFGGWIIQAIFPPHLSTRLIVTAAAAAAA